MYDLENISRRRISITSPKNFNDPLDSYFLNLNNSVLSETLAKIIPKDKQEALKMSCFANHEKMRFKKIDNSNTLTNEEILMWTHYANAHHGICIEYAIPYDHLKSIDDININDGKTVELNTFYLEEVSYADGLAVNYKHIVEAETSGYKAERLLQSIYCLKDKTFEYEHEYRLLCFSSDSKMYASIEFDYIKKIIFGIRCSSDTRYLVECINKHVYENKIELYSIDEHCKESPYGAK